MKRRAVLGGISGAAAALTARPARAALALAPPPLTLLVAGPDGGQTSRWGNACALAISQSMPGQPAIHTEADGGLDGVTGANQLDALVVPDGKTAAILPGLALIAYLMGDERVHYDPTRWQPLLAGRGSGVLLLRAGPTPPSVAALRGGRPLRLAADQAQSPDLAALLALARLGIPCAPVFGLRTRDAKTQAFVNGDVDAVFLCGEGVPEDIAPLTAAGAVPYCSIGALGLEGGIGPDPFFPGLPDAARLGPAVSPELDAAYQAAAAAAQLDFLLVLPRLTSPAAVANWSQAAAIAATSEGMTAAAAASAISLQPSNVLAGALTAMTIKPAAQTTMLAYLAKTYGWQPG